MLSYYDNSNYYIKFTYIGMYWKFPMILLEIKTLFDKHKDNEKSRSRETTSDKFYEVF